MDEETDESIAIRPSKVENLAEVVAEVFGLSKLTTKEFNSKAKVVGIKKKASIGQVFVFLQTFLADKQYLINDFIRLFLQIHTQFNKNRLEETDYLLLVSSVGIRLDEATIDRDRAAFAISKALKYVVLKKE